MGDVRVGLGDAGERRVELRQRRFRGGIDEEPTDDVQEVIAGRALDGPALGHPFVEREDLLDYDVTRAGLAQPLQIRVRILHAVDMIDAQSIRDARPHELEHQTMRLPEHLWVFDAQSDQGVYVEEAAIAEIALRRLPPRQTIVLLIEQPVERIGVGVVVGDRTVEGRRNIGFREQLFEHLGGHRVVPAAALDGLWIRFGGGWQRLERVGDKREPTGVEARGGAAQQLDQGARIERKLVLFIANREDRGVAPQCDLAALQRAAVLIREYRQQDDVAQSGLRRFPIDVEKPRIRTRDAVPQDVPPPAVLTARDGHVIRDRVDEMTEAGFLDGRNHARVRLSSAEVGAQARRIHDVVAVRAAGSGLQIR